MKNVNIVCVNWGTKYSPDYVLRLYNMIKKHTNRTFKMFCLTDNPDIYPDEITGIKLKPGFEGWWNKMQLFRDDVLPKGQYLYFDLDVVIVDNIDCLFDYQGFGITRDFINPENGLLGGKEYNSSIMRFTQNRALWKHFIDNQDRWKAEQNRISFFGDQNVISDFLNRTGFDNPFPDEWIWSFKIGALRGRTPVDHSKFHGAEVPRGGKVCVFHGQPNPCQVHVSWVTENWGVSLSEDPQSSLKDNQKFCHDMNTKFIVIAPPKNPKSAGSMVLYELADEISNLGYEATKVLLGQDNKGHFYISVDEKNYMPLGEETLEHLFNPQNSLIIHGENLHHKYFDKFNVARYYLNRIGALRNIGVPREGEYKIAWNKNFVDDPDFIIRKPVIKKPVHETLRTNQPRLIDLTYVGKGHLYDSGLCRLPGTFELTRSWPNDDDEYLLLLSKTRFLFTFDVQTAVIEDAIYYGVIPVLMTHMPLKNMQELTKSYPKELAECCLSFEDFEKLTDENVDDFYTDFFQKRQHFIAYLNKHKTEYRGQLNELITSIQAKFNPVPLSQKNTSMLSHQFTQKADLDQTASNL